MKAKINLKANIDEVSFNFLRDNYNFNYHETGLICYNKYQDVGEWIKFFENGSAVYSRDGSIKNLVEFKNYQDAVDFIRI